MPGQWAFSPAAVAPSTRWPWWRSTQSRSGCWCRTSRQPPRSCRTASRRWPRAWTSIRPLDTMPGRVVGAKPAAVRRRIFTLPGAGPVIPRSPVPWVRRRRPGMGRVHQLAGAVRSMAVNYPRVRPRPTRLAYLLMPLTYALPGTGPWALMARTPRSHDRIRRYKALSRPAWSFVRSR